MNNENTVFHDEQHTGDRSTVHLAPLQGEVTCSMQCASCMTEDGCGGVLE